MGKTYEICLKVNQIIEQQNLDGAQTRGKIGLKAGVLLSLVKADTPDDPAKLEKLRAAVQEVLHLEV